MEKTTYTIQNLKCGGCATQIISKLTKIKGISNVSVDELLSTVTMNHQRIEDLETAIRTLSDMGYPLFDDNNSLGTKAKSYVSCMIGRVKDSGAA